MNFQPDYRHILQAINNKRPKRLPLYEHLINIPVMEKILGYNFDTESNIIDVHINHLRKKIDRDCQPKLIHTIKGVGYVLKSE